jgi:hypothetical protein
MIGGTGLAPNGLPNKFLLPGSPAIDAGDNPTCEALDLYGVSRPQDGNGDGTATCDIGPYEAAGVPCTSCPPPSSGGDAGAAAPGAGGTAGAGSAPDKTPPTITLSGGSAAQDPLAQRGVKIEVLSKENGGASATGTFSARGASASFKLNPARTNLVANRKSVLNLGLGSKVKKALKKALKRKTLTANITVTVTDAAGNKASKGRRVKLKRGA